MNELLETIVRSLVNHPSEVRVEQTKDDRGILLTLHVAQDDMGKVIGKTGKTAEAIRTIIRCAGAKLNGAYSMKIFDQRDNTVV